MECHQGGYGKILVTRRECIDHEQTDKENKGELAKPGLSQK